MTQRKNGLKTWLAIITILMGVSACGPMSDDASEGGDTAEQEGEAKKCDYPSFSHSITLGSSMPPLAWKSALEGDAEGFRFDLVDVFCNDSTWSPFKALAFVAIPSW